VLVENSSIGGRFNFRLGMRESATGYEAQRRVMDMRVRAFLPRVEKTQALRSRDEEENGRATGKRRVQRGPQ